MSFGRGSVMTLRCQLRSMLPRRRRRPCRPGTSPSPAGFARQPTSMRDCPPHSSFALMSAPAATSSSAALTLSVRATTISGVSPSGFAALASAPASSNAAMIGVEACTAASESAEAPNSFRAVHIGTGFDEPLHQVDVAVICRPHQCRRAVRPARVHVAACLEQLSAPRLDRRIPRRRAAWPGSAEPPRSRAPRGSRRAVLSCQTSDSKLPLSPIDSTGICARSNNVANRSANRESCGYCRCWPPLIRPLRAAEHGRRQRIVVVAVAVAHVAAEQNRGVDRRTVASPSGAFASISMKPANIFAW